jgi:hypothetical protein
MGCLYTEWRVLHDQATLWINPESLCLESKRLTIWLGPSYIVRRYYNIKLAHPLWRQD